MSDDKREKLREYLKNNRPKNSVNLGNSSNNKENSNKNLENDLNLDNSQILNNDSDLDNSQISHNKTSSIKRDYDKEPIIIKSLSATRIYFYAILVVIAMFFLDKKCMIWKFFNQTILLQLYIIYIQVRVFYQELY